MSIHTYPTDSGWMAVIEHRGRKLIAELDSMTEFNAMIEAKMIYSNWVAEWMGKS